jgi:hypothetical protein
MLILLSPSKTMDFSKVEFSKYTLPQLLEQAVALIDNLRKLSKDEISKLMKLSHNLTDLNYERYRQFSIPFNIDNAKQAGFAFQGDVYDGLEFDKFSSQDIEYAQYHLRILSGLYGILKPLDLIQAYRLEMGTSLKNANGKNLYEFWGDKVTDILNGQEQELIVNLASNEYFKAVKKNKLKAKLITPIFKEYKNNEYKVIMLFAKRARGLMAKYLIENKIDSIDDIKKFNLDNYRYNHNLSVDSNFGENNIVFVR